MIDKTNKIEYLPVEIVANYHNVKTSSLKSLYYKKYKGKNKKFKLDNNGKLLVNLDYKYPLANKIEKLREEALKTAKNEHKLCKELSIISGKKVTTLQRYFIRFTFKQVKTAEEVINALEIYLSKVAK